MQKTYTSLIWTIMILCSLLMTACAPSLLDSAKQSVAFSDTVYQDLSREVVGGISEIVLVSETRAITEAERDRLEMLDNSRAHLDNYAAIHNNYVRVLQLWEQSGQQPSNLDLMKDQLNRVLNLAIDLALELNLKIPEGIR